MSDHMSPALKRSRWVQRLIVTWPADQPQPSPELAKALALELDVHSALPHRRYIGRHHIPGDDAKDFPLIKHFEDETTVRWVEDYLPERVA